jgi:hypothetical protein
VYQSTDAFRNIKDDMHQYHMVVFLNVLLARLAGCNEHLIFTVATKPTKDQACDQSKRSKE